MKNSYVSVVINPTAGNGKAKKLTQSLLQKIKSSSDFDLNIAFTKEKNDAVYITRKAIIEGATMIISVGGDGTINEVVNGFFQDGKPLNPKCELGVINCGTGGGYARTLNTPHSIELQIEQLLQPGSRTLDLGRISYMESAGTKAERLFVNECQVGIGCKIAQSVGRKSKIFGGTIAFGISAQLFLRYGYLIIAILVLFASLIRMWAGSILTSKTVMTFRIQNSKLNIPGLIYASYSGKFIYAILIGLPAVIDWAVIHTIIGVSAGTPTREKSLLKKRKLSNSKVFRDVLYAQCWEDPEMDRIAFDIKPGDTVFSITSGGCNALTFLLDDPGKVICLDMNRFQNYLLRLKISAFKTLGYNEMLEFFGVRASKRRWELYEKLKSVLSEEEQLYWSNKKSDLNRGIIHCGKYERYMHLLKRVFRILIGEKIISELFNSSSLEEQRILFKTKWDNFKWRLFCRVLLSRTFASILFDKAFYKYLEPKFSFEKYYRSAVMRAVTELPVKENYFIAYILLGNYLDDNLPVYLKKENYEFIRDRVDRIYTVTSGCQEYMRTLPKDTISKFNFTNIFEWMSMEEFTLLLLETLRIAKDGAVITYRNHLVTRNRPEAFAEKIIPDMKLSLELRKRDRSFIYKAYVVERINKNLCHS